LVAIALAGRWRARLWRRSARARSGALRAVGVVAVALGAGAALTLPPLVAMTHLAGPTDYGNPDFASQIGSVGPWVMLRPALLLGSWPSLAGMTVAVVAVVLSWRRAGIRSLALGTIMAWAVVFVPPVATVIAETASTLYLRRLAAIPDALAVPLVGATAAVAAVVVGTRLGRRGVRPASDRRFIPVAVLSTLVIIAASFGVVVATRTSLERPPWLPVVAWDRLLQGDESDQIRRLAAMVGKWLPAGSVVLSDPVTSYWLPAVLDVRVVAVPATHSLSTDPARVSVQGQTVAGQDVWRFLRAADLSAKEQRAILDLYGVTNVVLDPVRSHRIEKDFRAERRALRVEARGLGRERLAVYTRR
jgi:hypothetical protein